LLQLRYVLATPHDEDLKISEMKTLLKEAFRDAMALSALIIVPMLFLGPGWAPKSDKALQASFADLHPERSHNDDPAHLEHHTEVPLLGDFENDREVKNR